MKKLIKRLIFILIGLSLSQCNLFKGEDLTKEFYNGIYDNQSIKDIKLLFYKGNTDNDLKISRTLKLKSKKDSIYYDQFSTGDIKESINFIIDDVNGTKIELYTGDSLVKTWNGPHGDYGNEKNPYNYNSWIQEVFDLAIEKPSGDSILGNYTFTIIDEDLE